MAPGRYYESVVLPSNRHIRSTGGSEVTHWYGTNTNVIRITGGDNTLIDGFSIHPWDGSGAPQPADMPTAAATRGLQISDAIVHLEDIRVSAHTSSLTGAAVWVSDSTVTIQASLFTDLTADSGGAIDANRSTVVLTDNEFTGNSASLGGSLNCTSSVIQSSYTRFANNLAEEASTGQPGWGGAIRTQRCNLTTSHDQFLRNSGGLGGHVYVEAGQLLADHTLFANGSADRGGAVWFNGSSIELNGSLFRDNTAVDAAGAIYIDHRLDALYSVDGAVFLQNTSDGLGGAIRMVSEVIGAELDLNNSRFQDNSSATGGGAVSTRGIKYVGIHGSSFLDNQATQDNSGGGAVRGELAAGLAGSLHVSNSYFCRNNAGAGGAVAYNTQNNPVELLDSVWVDNSAISAGAFLIEGAEFIAEHNDFLDNSASAAGPVGVLRSADMAFESNIVTPTPVSNGAIFASGTFGLAYSDYNLWWMSVQQTYGGAIQPRNVNGDHELTGDALLSGYDSTQGCLDWTFEPDFGSPVFASDNGVIGVTGGALGPSAFTDADNDGVARPMDCDDNNPATYPGAAEACDGVDNNCNGLVNDIDTDSPPVGAQTFFYDADNDGFGGATITVSCRQQTRWVTTGRDCVDTDRTIFPTAEEVWYDGIDQNCDERNDFDQDNDGFAFASPDFVDCDDQDAAVNTDAEETWYDGIDQDCDQANDFDQDGDGSAINDDVPDCDDEDNTLSPLNEEVWYDGVDQNCDGADDFDQDGDGQQQIASGGDDCNDTNATIYLNADEIWYDGIDQDCAADNDFDQDGDGFTTRTGGPPSGQDDCNDEDPAVFPEQREIPNDGIDQDCDGFDFVDVDEDGFASTDVGGADCNDDAPGINPSAEEIPYDEIDQDCDGLDVVDADGDGFVGIEAGGDDCDDDNGAISPDAEEIWYDGIDQDCNGANDYDQDGDLWVVQDGDCDDLDPARNPGAQEQANSGLDLNCDGYAPISIVTGAGCSAVPSAPAYWGLLAGLLALGFRRRK
ncbi:MAG: hypothetical protein ACJA00_004387 [Myxococcota bacterium]